MLLASIDGGGPQPEADLGFPAGETSVSIMSTIMIDFIVLWICHPLAENSYEDPSPPARQRFTVAVIGGGFTGTTLAVQWVSTHRPSFSVVVIERMGLPGRGVAYGTACDSHLLNVPAKDMSAFPQYPEHFLSWAK